MANNEFTSPIPARLKNVAKGGHVAGAEDIIDDALGKEQSVVNQEVSEAIEGNTQAVATERQRAEAAEGALDNRLSDVEELAEISIDGGEAKIATGEDFHNPTAEQRAKVTTVGAILDGADDEPTPGSENLVKSGGVKKAVDSNYVNVLKNISDIFNINLFDKNSPYNVNGYLDVNGRIYESQDYIVTHYIPFTQQIGKLTLSANGHIGSMNIAYVLYDSLLNVVNTVIEDPTQPIEATWEESVSYIRFTINNILVDSVKVTIGDNSNKGAYVNFGEVSYKYVDGSKLESGAITADKIANEAITTEKILNGSVTTEKIQDGAVTAEKLDIIELVAGKNLLDPTKIVTNRWIKADGAFDYVTSDYGYYDYIEVKPNTQYHISNKEGNALSNRTDCYIAFYNSDKECITSASVTANTTDITTPNNAAYVRISIVVARVTNMEAQMEEGTERTEYQPYAAPSPKIEKQYIQLPDEIPGESIEDGSITQEKLASGIIAAAKPNQFNGWSNSSDSIAAGGQLLIVDKVFRSRKGFQYCCVVNGLIDNIRLLIGDLYIDVTSTSFSVNGGTAQAHGLTLGTITTFILNCGNDKNITSNTTFRIINDAGATYEKTGLDFRIFRGSVGIKNNNSVTAIGAKVNVFNKDLTKKIWMFGDSYFSYIDPSRWVYYLMQWGYINYLLNAMSGENATQALNDLNMLLESGHVPSYVVWCLGMNDAADSGSSVNPTWMEKTNALIAICEAKGIQPIFATIPSVPSISHVALNNWVRNSGYRYVDFAASVENAEQGGSNYWRLWGDDPTTPNDGSLLSSDKVHPTQYGAVELAARFLADFPEITVLDN